MLMIITNYLKINNQYVENFDILLYETTKDKLYFSLTFIYKINIVQLIYQSYPLVNKLKIFGSINVRYCSFQQVEIPLMDL